MDGFGGAQMSEDRKKAMAEWMKSFLEKNLRSYFLKYRIDL